MPDRTDSFLRNDDAPPGGTRSVDCCRTRARKILQFKHYCTDAPI